ncbi:hypothetical protein [Aeromicrobium massiliense]|uniref:hypothetical protein n=1 Tax=Aeromicrobium massiliense TaxID=1464554 RepID=UPI0002DEA28D|nr:hypothetical protein [Aeromicrobium massiliense]
MPSTVSVARADLDRNVADVRLGDAGGTRGHYGPAPPPPDDVEPYTLLDMLEDMLGAHVIDEERSATA